MTTNNNLSIAQMREIVSKAPANAESYQGGYYFRESPQFMFHNGFHDQWNLTDNDGLYFRAAGFHPIRIDDLRTAIAKHDELLGNSEELKMGDLVVSKDKNDQTLYEIKRIHHNKIDNWNYLYLKNTMYKNSGERGDYADKYEHASVEEIKAGHRIDDATDHVTDIRNHVSPSTIIKDLEAERHG